MDTLRSAFFRTLTSVTEKITVLETRADRTAYRGGAPASTYTTFGGSHLTLSATKQKPAQTGCFLF